MSRESSSAIKSTRRDFTRSAFVGMGGLIMQGCGTIGSGGRPSQWIGRRVYDQYKRYWGYVKKPGQSWD
jgi:hypothetical protein